MTKTQAARLAKISRRIALLSANTAALEGRHDDARAEYAALGIGYAAITN